MRRLTVLMAVVLAAALAGCGPAAVDPYQLTSNVLTKPWERVQVNIGFSVRTADTTVSVAPEMMRLVIDTVAEKGLFSVSIPAEALGMSRAELAMSGLPDSTLELDLLFDSEALYARAPFLASIVPFLVAGGDGLPDGDLTGWLRLGTMADFDALGQMMSGMEDIQATGPDWSALVGLDAAELRDKLERSGITLIHEGSDTRNGMAAERLSITVDYVELAESELFAGMDSRDLELMAASGLTLTTDLWIAQATGMPIEIVANGSSADIDVFQFVMLFSEPDPSVSLEAPANFIDVPLLETLDRRMDPFGPREWDDEFWLDEEFEWDDGSWFDDEFDWDDDFDLD
jgi:hypothetical protein